jgi:hypothetical protein
MLAAEEVESEKERMNGKSIVASKLARHIDFGSVVQSVEDDNRKPAGEKWQRSG